LDEVGSRIRERCAAESAKSGLSTAQIAEAVKLSTRALRTRLGKLVEQGLLAVVGKSERDPQRKYSWKG
jgi:predicted ArsR family transcriptional regulator